jgi:hypothetical protein
MIQFDTRQDTIQCAIQVYVQVRLNAGPNMYVNLYCLFIILVWYILKLSIVDAVTVSAFASRKFYLSLQ